MGALHKSSGVNYLPEENPFNTVFVDLTHRCNMKCRNCYIPNRHVPDMDAEWLYGIIARLSRRTRLRLVGAEPTLRRDLTEIIRTIRSLGHMPVLMSNGLKLSDRDYTAKLKQAGLRTVYLSMNGGTDDDIYKSIDSMRCAEKKIAALDALCAENMNITVGMIVSRELGSQHVEEFYRYLRPRKQVTEFHLRNIGPMGRHMQCEKLSMDDLIQIASNMTGMSADSIIARRHNGNHYIDFTHDSMNIQLTDWPDLGNPYRGRLTPDGMIEPCFENLIANEGGY
jgi:molybdenum cofactor biosynthesis enzyme MoaA